MSRRKFFPGIFPRRGTIADNRDLTFANIWVLGRMNMDRRNFLSRIGQVAAASSVTKAAKTTDARDKDSPAEPLPEIMLGSNRVSRLVVGSNPLLGYSYLGPHTDRHMREYFTADRTVEFLLSCEKAGINTLQFSYSKEGPFVTIVKMARDRGSNLKFFSLARTPEEIRALKATTGVFAAVHHGGVTDRHFAEGNRERVHDFVKAAHDEGLLGGVSAHNPDCIREIADAGWEVDFFMTCFYFLTRKTFAKPGEKPVEPETLHLSYPFYRDDPTVMTRVIRQVDQPCLAFKILAAGRKCSNQNAVRNAFQFAYKNIKPTDGVIVGMYPRFYDEISANAQYARDYGRAKT